MASEAPNAGLPILYEGLEPISTEKHGKLKIDRVDAGKVLAKVHAVPVTVEEFHLLQRNFPVIFSAGESPVPLALMGLHEGVNAFVDDNGKLTDDYLYLPAYVRRYPFMLARLNEQSEELSLCYDPTSGALGSKGEPLFDKDGKASEQTTKILKFCEQFEQAAQRTGAFMKELMDMDLLMGGEVSVQPEGMDKPFIYRGFQMINEEKLRELSGDKLRKMNQNGMLPVIMAHLFSLGQIREVFARQVDLGKGPKEIVELKKARDKATENA
ncbi:SapC family protein [Sphingomicrobium nitratireducens]|uniref:SapC family protein n=1 Tax=Sphingomicrobium nitratireducens TaxID=2964666 RepID=UPI0022403027|nr:SapC family protein [Sphingomicrobium nitratireducens]